MRDVELKSMLLWQSVCVNVTVPECLRVSYLLSARIKSALDSPTERTYMCAQSATCSSFKSKLKTFLFSQNISVKQYCPSPLSVCTVCVCVCMCVGISSIVFKNPCRYLLLFLIKFSISMCIMCVCLFSAWSHRVGALQISIIIISSKMF